ncbi:MAG TPA: DedA family protein [Candidatus Nanoarchaeia archaeon]|nr:DedA family protein [Candidatus Nanoarchaeia archaeon]
MVAYLSSLIIEFVQLNGYLAVFILMTLESALIPIPSEITMPFAGFMVYKGILSFWLVALVGAFANLVGSLIGYYIGMLFQEESLLKWIRKYGKFILLDEHDYMRSRMWFEEHGKSTVFFSRLLPGVRTFISLPAGVFRVPLFIFSVYTFVGSFIWSALLTYIGFYLGSNWMIIEYYFEKFHVVIIVTAVILIGYFLYRKLFRKKTI